MNIALLICYRNVSWLHGDQTEDDQDEAALSETELSKCELSFGYLSTDGIKSTTDGLDPQA